MSVTVDSYASANNYSAIYSTRMAGQSFDTDTFAGKLIQIKVKLSKFGSPTGNCYVKLYAHTGTYGTSSNTTGSALATSDAVDVSTLEAAPFQTDKTFSFSGANQYDLEASTYYCLEFTYSGGDASNHVRFSYHDSSPSHDGNYIYNGSAVSTSDAYFYVYGDDTVYGAANLIGAGALTAAGGLTKLGAGTLTGAGALTAAGSVLATLYFLQDPQVTVRQTLATHVIVQSPTNEATAYITPEPAAAVRIERLVKIDSGDATVCAAVAAELIDRWGRDQISVSGVIPLDVRLTFMQKVGVIIPQAGLNTALILQRKEHNITDMTTSVVLGDIILDENELISRIIEDLSK